MVPLQSITKGGGECKNEMESLHYDDPGAGQQKKLDFDRRADNVAKKKKLRMQTAHPTTTFILLYRHNGLCEACSSTCPAMEHFIN